MAGPKAALGFRSRTDAVIALRAQGKSTDAIAAALGIPAKNVIALEASRARQSVRAGHQVEGGRAVLFPAYVLDRLGPHAARRNMPANSLARLIVETVVAAGMVDAVMDDADDLQEAS